MIGEKLNRRAQVIGRKATNTGKTVGRKLRRTLNQSEIGLRKADNFLTNVAMPVSAIVGGSEFVAPVAVGVKNLRSDIQQGRADLQKMRQDRRTGNELEKMNLRKIADARSSGNNGGFI